MHQQLRAPAAAILFLMASLGRSCAEPNIFRSNDVVAWVGGTDVASARDSAHFETLLSASFPSVRFRNFGWEGDTVFAQPRDVNFPPLREQMKRAGVTVVLLQFGRAESLVGSESAESFRNAYGTMAGTCAGMGARVVLLAPAPFESGGGLLPDLSGRNHALAEHVAAIREVSRIHHWQFVDAFGELIQRAGKEPRLTGDGLALTPYGHAAFARTAASLLGCSDALTQAGEAQPDGRYGDARFEALRQVVIEKNRLWFNYWRPQNWAFLGGDRVTQPSSRDHRDPSIRWFPAEMERYVPLIRAKEEQIEAAAKALQKGQP